MPAVSQTGVELVNSAHTHAREERHVPLTHVCAEDSGGGLEALVPQVARGSDR